jgi:hypothetical protein
LTERIEAVNCHKTKTGKHFSVQFLKQNIKDISDGSLESVSSCLVCRVLVKDKAIFQKQKKIRLTFFLQLAGLRLSREINQVLRIALLRIQQFSLK